MVFEFLAGLDNTHMFLMIIIFVLFVMSMKKAFSIVVNTVWVAGISLLFPIIMNRFFGLDIPTDIDSLLSFTTLGVGLYFVWVVASTIYKILNIAGKFMGKVPKPQISLPKKGEKEDKYSRKEVQLREKELKLQEREMRLKEKEEKKKEKHDSWMARLNSSQKPVGKNAKKEDDFVELEDKEDPKKKNFAEPMKEINPKKKKKDKEED
jgi:hypothetical protein